MGILPKVQTEIPLVRGDLRASEVAAAPVHRHILQHAHSLETAPHNKYPIGKPQPHQNVNNNMASVLHTRFNYFHNRTKRSTTSIYQ